jgi:hypothetical protein
MKNPDKPKTWQGKRSAMACKARGLLRRKHLRSRTDGFHDFDEIRAAIADEQENRSGYREAHAAQVAGCAGSSKDSRLAKLR